MSQPVVVVVEPDAPAQSAPVAVAEAVTPGELQARLELLETNLSDRISQAVEAAYEARVVAEDAQVTAEGAQESAEIAAIVAAVAAEEATEDTDGDAEDGGSDATGGVEEEEGGIHAPQRRENTADQEAGGDAQPKKTAGGYGAGWLSGR